MATKTLILTKAGTTELKIPIGIPPEKPTITGWFTGVANILPKPFIKQLFDLIADDELHEFIRADDNYKHLHDRIDKQDISREELLLRIIYQGFDGIGNEKVLFEGEDAWNAVLSGEFSAYLTPAAMQRYYEQYGEAQKGNSKKSRKR
jgi:hypothetical protein